MRKSVTDRSRSANGRPGAFDPTAAKTAFLQKMQNAGLDPRKPITADGRCHDFKTDRCKGWYAYHEEFDHAWGVAHNWRTNEDVRWSSRGKIGLPTRDVQSIRRTPDPEVEEAEARKVEKRRQAKRLLRYCTEEDDDHRYLVRKQVWAHGVCVFPTHRIIAGEDIYRALAVPIYDDDEEPQGIQFILSDGTKRNLGPTSGGHFWIGQPSRGRTLCIAEGFATACSVYEDTGYRCCVSFGHSGFAHVAQYVRKTFDPRKLIIVADGDDVSVKSANAAARASDGLVWIAARGCDYNDMVNGVRA